MFVFKTSIQIFTIKNFHPQLIPSNLSISFSQGRVEMSEASILKARDGFRSIAQRAAVCFDVTQYMREVSPLYQTSYIRFLDLYDAAVSHSER